MVTLVSLLLIRPLTPLRMQAASRELGSPLSPNPVRSTQIHVYRFLRYKLMDFRHTLIVQFGPVSDLVRIGASVPIPRYPLRYHPVVEGLVNMTSLYYDRETRNTYRLGLKYPHGYIFDHINRRAGRHSPQLISLAV